jgi:hypothetical protein
LEQSGFAAKQGGVEAKIIGSRVSGMCCNTTAVIRPSTASKKAFAKSTFRPIAAGRQIENQ